MRGHRRTEKGKAKVERLLRLWLPALALRLLQMMVVARMGKMAITMKSKELKMKC